MIAYLRQNAIEGPWETSDRLLVCIGPDALSEKVVRAASRLATGLNANWLVVTVERPGHDAPDATSQYRLDQNFRLAERLGAETRRISGHDYVGEILRLARRENATQIVLGRGEAGWWQRTTGRSLPDALLRQSSDIGICVITGEETDAKPVPGSAQQNANGTGQNCRRWCRPSA